MSHLRNGAPELEGPLERGSSRESMKLDVGTRRSLVQRFRGSCDFEYRRGYGGGRRAEFLALFVLVRGSQDGDTTNEFSFVQRNAKTRYRQLGIGADKAARVIYEPVRLIRTKKVSPLAKKKDTSTFPPSRSRVKFLSLRVSSVRLARWTCVNC